MSKDSVLVDEVAAKIMRTLLENPTMSYNKSQLSKAAAVSRPAFYIRFKALRNRGVIEAADVASGHQYWTLNADSDVANALATILYPKGENDN